jgi:hypothetical protein
VEPRLKRRYSPLVQQHLHAAGKSFAGSSAPPDENTAFAAAQAAWRFLHNERGTLPKLAEPLLQVARQWRREQPNAWALVIHDGSFLNYSTHASKPDRKRHGAAPSLGYHLGTMLLVDGRQGDPAVPAWNDGQFRRTREVTWQGQTAIQFVAEAAVVLARPAWRHVVTRGRRSMN